MVCSIKNSTSEAAIILELDTKSRLQKEVLRIDEFKICLELLFSPPVYCLIFHASYLAILFTRMLRFGLVDARHGENGGNRAVVVEYRDLDQARYFLPRSQDSSLWHPLAIRLLQFLFIIGDQVKWEHTWHNFQVRHPRCVQWTVIYKYT
jgi:hypothetical protein